MDIPPTKSAQVQVRSARRNGRTQPMEEEVVVVAEILVVIEEDDDDNEEETAAVDGAVVVAVVAVEFSLTISLIRIGINPAK